jgi:LysR family glycine cleavage system transcriptional activator
MFDAAARHLNFRLAAEELNLTQGAVAQQVRQLESKLGIQLFYRKARGLELTEAGRSYHLPVGRALEIIEDATLNLQPSTTDITLSVTPTFASKWLVPRLTAFSSAHPEIEVHTLASTDQANFQSDGVDLAVRFLYTLDGTGLANFPPDGVDFADYPEHSPFGRNLHCVQLVPLDLRAVCSPGFAKELAPIMQIEDFLELQLIQSDQNHWDRLFEEAGLRAHHRMIRFSHTTLAMDAAAHGQGIALAPRLLLNHELEQGRLVELWQDKRTDLGGYYIVYPRKRVSDQARDLLIEWMLSEVRNTKTE